MASIPVPQTDPSSQDWARDAEASISHVDEDSIPKPGRGSPPMQNVPGSFSAGGESEGTEGGGHSVLDTAQQTWHNATETAKQYLPESIGSYLPGSQAHGVPPKDLSEAAESSKDVPHHIGTPEPGSGTKPCLSTHHHHLPAPGTKAQKYTLPSTETPGGSAIGIGSLPGNKSEVSVAKLPEERLQENLPSHETADEPLGKPGGVGPLPGPPNESGVALAPEERIHTEDEVFKRQIPGGNPAVVVASAVAAGATAAAVTYRDAPAPGQESGAPDSRARAASMGQEEGQTHKLRTVPGTMQQLSDTDLPAIGDVPPCTEQKRYPCPRHPHNVPGTQEEVSETVQEGKSARSAEERVASPAEGVTAAGEGTASPGERTTPPVETPAPGAQKKSAADRRASTGSTGKRFMGWVKGEAMVVSGKLARNEKKVEEGKHLMGRI